MKRTPDDVTVALVVLLGVASAAVAVSFWDQQRQRRRRRSSYLVCETCEAPTRIVELDYFYEYDEFGTQDHFTSLVWECDNGHEFESTIERTTES